jgi:hypothetical protein
MRVFLVSAVAMVAIAVGSMFILDQVVQRNADQAFSSSTSVRLPDHGNTHNLVGRDWYSAKEHGWGDEIPTSNSPISNPPSSSTKQ